MVDGVGGVDGVDGADMATSLAASKDVRGSSCVGPLRCLLVMGGCKACCLLVGFNPSLPSCAICAKIAVILLLCARVRGWSCVGPAAADAADICCK